MRLALAAVLAGCRADNATYPRPNAAALLEAATKLRAEAAALESQAQAEAVALESARVEQQKAAAAAPAPTPAPVATPPPPVSEPALAPSAFAGIDKSREAFVSTLGSLKESGQATKWNSAALVADGAENPTEARVRAATGINGAKDLLSQEEVSNDQLGALTAGVFVVSAILAIASGALIGGNVGATFTYVFAVLPIARRSVGTPFDKVLDVSPSLRDTIRPHRSSSASGARRPGLLSRCTASSVAPPRTWRPRSAAAATSPRT